MTTELSAPMRLHDWRVVVVATSRRGTCDL